MYGYQKKMELRIQGFCFCLFLLTILILAIPRFKMSTPGEKEHSFQGAGEGILSGQVDLTQKKGSNTTQSDTTQGETSTPSRTSCALVPGQKISVPVTGDLTVYYYDQKTDLPIGQETHSLAGVTEITVQESTLSAVTTFKDVSNVKVTLPERQRPWHIGGRAGIGAGGDGLDLEAALYLQRDYVLAEWDGWGGRGAGRLLGYGRVEGKMAMEARKSDVMLGVGVEVNF